MDAGVTAAEIAFVLRFQRALEFFDRNPCPGDQAPQGAACNLRMIRNGERGDMPSFRKDHVAAPAPFSSHFPTQLLKSSDYFLRSNSNLLSR